MSMSVLKYHKGEQMPVFNMTYRGRMGCGLKKLSSNGSWQSRTFVLKSTSGSICLLYKHYNHTTVVDISSIGDIVQNAKYIDLIFSKSVYKLKARTENDASTWVHIIKEHYKNAMGKSIKCTSERVIICELPQKCYTNYRKQRQQRR